MEILSLQLSRSDSVEYLAAYVRVVAGEAESAVFKGFSVDFLVGIHSVMNTWTNAHKRKFRISRLIRNRAWIGNRKALRSSVARIENANLVVIFVRLAAV